VGLIFLLGVTVLGLFVGRLAIFIGALLCSLIWDFFFIPPHYTFTISAPGDYMMFAMFLGAAGIIGHLTTRLRLNERHLRIRERRISVLYELTREIASAKDIHSVLDQAVEHIGIIFESDVAVLIKDPEKGLSLHEGSTLILDEKEIGVAEWVALHSRPAGMFTDTLPSAKAYYIPLVASRGTVGVLGLRPHRKRPASPELTAFIETCARQLAVGIEREQFKT
jgi:two-component system sensor histidine kinase KdpD